MANTMQRLTPNARRVLRYAQEEANYLQSSFIGTEYMLVALVREEHGIAGKVLRELGAAKQQLQSIEEHLARSDTPRMTNAPPELSPGVKRVLELAVVEAHLAMSASVDTVHLLLGMMRLTEGAAMDILKQMGITPATVRQRVEQERNRKNDETASQ